MSAIATVELNNMSIKCSNAHILHRVLRIVKTIKEVRVYEREQNI